MSKNNANAPWTNEHDLYLIENVHMTNEELAAALGRSSSAIQLRRAHHAARIHQAHPEMSVEACSIKTRANSVQTLDVLTSWRSKEFMYTNFLNKRQRQEEPQPAQFAPGQPSQWPPADATHPATATTLENTTKVIQGMCQEIARDEGKLSGLFEDEERLPFLVMFYPGFAAYALHLRGI